jgi:energy-coupling factor transport system permease protein
MLYLTTGYDADQLNPTFYPLHFPPLPLVPTAAILLAAVAGFAAPPLPKRLAPPVTTPAAERGVSDPTPRLKVSA